MAGRYYIDRKAYKKARVRKLLDRFYKRVEKHPVVLARYNAITKEWEE